MVMACNLHPPAILFQGDSIAKSVGSEYAEGACPGSLVFDPVRVCEENKRACGFIFKSS